ncbi:unnamed protein product [Lampetra planeri]
MFEAVSGMTMRVATVQSDESNIGASLDPSSHPAELTASSLRRCLRHSIQKVAFAFATDGSEFHFWSKLLEHFPTRAPLLNWETLITRQESLDAVRPSAPSLDVAGLLACAGCSGRVRPPIRQCPRGHLACTPCTAAAGPSPRCPACWGPAAAARNLALERLALMCGVAT